jgi:hypothetical protein
MVLAGSRSIIYMQIHSVGIDLGKTTFHLVALSAAGNMSLGVAQATFAKFNQDELQGCAGAESPTADPIFRHACAIGDSVNRSELKQLQAASDLGPALLASPCITQDSSAVIVWNARGAKKGGGWSHPLRKSRPCSSGPK